MIFLDIDVNTLEITFKMWSRKMQEILDILDKMANKLVTNRKEIQQLARILSFACRCICSGRVYLSQILNFLKRIPNTIRYQKKDVDL